MKKPKHLSHYSDDQFKDSFAGSVGFLFGFAEPGATSRGNGYHFKFIGNYARKKDAKQMAEQSGGYVCPYLNGKLKRGWVVLVDLPESLIDTQ